LYNNSCCWFYITNEAFGLSLEKAKEFIAVTLGMLESVPPEEAACSEMVALALKASMDTYIHKRVIQYSSPYL